MMDAVNTLFGSLSAHIVLALNVLATLLVVIGTVQAIICGPSAILSGQPTRTRALWTNYARWLVAALTFQLAGDIVATAITPDWQEIGRLAATAVIRTFLNYFLERDLGEAHAREADSRHGN